MVLRRREVERFRRGRDSCWGRDSCARQRKQIEGDGARGRRSTIVFRAISPEDEVFCIVGGGGGGREEEER